MEFPIQLVADQISKHLGYRDVSRLGTGGFAEVFRAFDPQLQRFVALKLLMARKPEFVERMFREARAQAKIRHEGICEIYQVGWLDTIPFLAMQLIDGEDLGSLIPTLDLDQKLAIAIKVCVALQAAHDRGLVHRDLKPSNIMIERVADRLNPFVVDFGLVWELDNPELTGSGCILGTPGYMAPEQVEGRHCGVLSDVYGLGATFYELFCGAPPFHGAPSVTLLKKVLDEEPLPANEKNPELSRDLAAVLARAMAKDPQQRYQDVPSLARDLIKVQQGEPVEATLVSPAQRWWRSFSRHRISARLSLLTLGLCIAIVVGWQWRSERRLQNQTFYASVAQDIKNNFRSALMSPAHDIRVDIDGLRRRQQSLTEDLQHRGSLAAGPIHFAIATGHVQLGEYQAAERHLQKAWDLGYRDPEVALELGRAHAQIFREKRWRLGALTTPTRKNMMTALDQEHRRVAVAFLQQVRPFPSVPVAEIETQLAWVEGEYEKALEHVRRLRRQAPWQYEHLMLEADILEDQVMRSGWSGESSLGEKELEMAQALLVEVHERAPSDPKPVQQLCRLMANRVKLLSANGISAPLEAIEPFYRVGLTACESALVLNRGSAESWGHLSDLHIFWSNALTWSGDAEAGQVLETGLESARSALAIDPSEPIRKQNVAQALAMKAEYLLHRGQENADIPVIFDEAIQLLEEVLEQEPESSTSWSMLGRLLNHKGIYLHRNHGDSVGSMLRSCQVLERASALDPDRTRPHYLLSSSYQQLVWAAGFLPASLDLPRAEWNRKGIEHGLKAVQISPLSGWAHLVLGDLFLQEGELALAQDLSPTESWARGFEHMITATQVAPESPAFLFRLVENLVGVAHRLTLQGDDSERYLAAGHSIFALRRDILSAEQSALLELDLKMAGLLRHLVLGQSVAIGPLHDRADKALANRDSDHFLRRFYRTEILMYSAMDAATRGEPSAALFIALRESIGNLRSDQQWLSGLASILEAHTVADAASRRAALDQAEQFLHPDRLPQSDLKVAEIWLNLAHRLPQSGVVPFRLFDHLGELPQPVFDSTPGLAFPTGDFAAQFSVAYNPALKSLPLSQPIR